MKIAKVLFLGLTLIFTLGFNSCKKYNFENSKTLRQLYKQYKNGEISECKYLGETVYSAGLNMYDAGGAIYDYEGNQIGTCNFAWGGADSICNKLSDYKTIYRIKNNIWDKPPVDKYGLN